MTTMPDETLATSTAPCYQCLAKNKTILSLRQALTAASEHGPVVRDECPDAMTDLQARFDRMKDYLSRLRNNCNVAKYPQCLPSWLIEFVNLEEPFHMPKCDAFKCDDTPECEHPEPDGETVNVPNQDWLSACGDGEPVTDGQRVITSDPWKRQFPVLSVDVPMPKVKDPKVAKGGSIEMNVVNDSIGISESMAVIDGLMKSYPDEGRLKVLRDQLVKAVDVEPKK